MAEVEIIDTTKEVIEYRQKWVNILPAFAISIFTACLCVVIGLKLVDLFAEFMKKYLECNMSFHWFRFAMWVVGIGVFCEGFLPSVGSLWDRVTVFDDVLTYTSGIIDRKKMSLPFRSISAIKREKKLFQRLIGVEDVVFYGYGGFHFRAKGMSIPYFSPYEDEPEAKTE